MNPSPHPWKAKNHEEIREEFRERLSSVYGERECESLFFHYLEGRFQLKRHDFFLRKQDPFPPENYGQFREDLFRLSASYPVQYLLGECEFSGWTFRVDGQVLIPRPETEELVRRIFEKHDLLSEKRVLDIGTGSGNIAISLAKRFPRWKIMAVDISSGALAVARENARARQVRILFQEMDILSAEAKDFPFPFDVIVSNPPYIPESEKEKLHDNVVRHEPALALFVPENDPLLYYRKIAELGKTILHPEGILYLEIHERYPSELERLFKERGYGEIRMIQDLQGRPRFLVVRPRNSHF